LGVAIWEGLVVARWGREVIDWVRVGPANALRTLRSGRHATLEAVVSDDSGLAAAIAFAKRLRKCPPQPSFPSTPASSGRQRPHQGHQANGLRFPRLACLFLKIKAAFPGKAR